MKCPKCNKVIKKTDETCKYCGVTIDNKQNIKTQIIYKTVENSANKWLILGIGILSFLVVIETSFIVWYFLINKPIKDTKTKIENYNYVATLPYDIYKPGEEIEFDDLLINVSKNYEIFTLDNVYSIYYGRNIIKIPVTITNNSDTRHGLNLFYYDIYDDNGNNIDEVAGYFDESLFYAEDLEVNASYTKYIYALYYGNDSYTIKISNKNKTNYIKYKIK